MKGKFVKTRFARIKLDSKDIEGHYLPHWLYDKPLEIVNEEECTYTFMIHTTEPIFIEVQKKHCTLVKE